MHDSNIDIKIIYKKIEGKVNKEENRLFEEWYQDSSHQKYFKKIQEYHELRHEPSIGKEQTDTAWSKLAKRIKKDRHTRRHNLFAAIMTAASVAMILISSSLWLKKNDSTPEKAVSSEILPGKYSAILELEDGSTLNLNQLTENNKAQIKKHIHIDSNYLCYKHQIKEKNLRLEYNKIIVPRGGEFQLILADSSKVWLNSESQLKYPIAFGPDKREIYLEGEAYFEVTKDSTRPFTVYAGSQKVTVSGTSFGITSYPEENFEATTLVEGKVNVEFPQYGNKVYTLTPGYQVRYDRKHAKIIHEMVATDEYTAWKDGKYIFQKKRLEDILNTLSRWYDFQVFYQNSRCKEILFSGEIQRFENFNTILNLLKKSSDADFTVNDNIVQVKTKF